MEQLLKIIDNRIGLDCHHETVIPWPPSGSQCQSNQYIKALTHNLGRQECEIMKTVTLTLLLEYVFTLLLFAGNLFSPVPSFEFQMWSCQRTKF